MPASHIYNPPAAAPAAGGPLPERRPVTLSSDTLTVLPQRARQPLHPDISEDLIETLVRHFYSQVREDSLLGPIFAGLVQDWEPHLRTMVDFWSSVTLMTGRFHGQPMQKHMAIPDLGPEHFSRWLGLFRASAREVLSPDIAALFIDRAERIADSLLRGTALGTKPPFNTLRGTTHGDAS